jgi:hypothetical protein
MPHPPTTITASLETMPTDIYIKIFSYLSTATFGPTGFMRLLWACTHTPWNQIGSHPLQHLYSSSKNLRRAVEAYCKHRLQHLLNIRPPGKGPEMPIALPYYNSYLRYMAGRCTFCYERVLEEDRGAVDFTIPVCWQCKADFPRARMINWERAEEEYELPLEELKANCAWAPIEETRSFYHTGRSSHKTYVFDDRDIQRHIKLRYGDLDTFFAAIEKKDSDKELELERMAKQRRWAREEIERRITACDPMVERFIDWERTIRFHRNAEEEAVRNRWIKKFRLYVEEQVTADVLLKYGLDSLFEPMRIRKRRRQRAIDY